MKWPIADSSPCFDQVVLCADMACAELLRPLGFHVLLGAVHAHSIDAPIREPLEAPTGALIDTSATR